jgi:hypothetical protein
MKPLILSPNLGKSQLAELVERYLIDSGFSISTQDFERPWGGFFVLLWLYLIQSIFILAKLKY